MRLKSPSYEHYADIHMDDASIVLISYNNKTTNDWVLTTLRHMMLQCTTNTPYDSGLTFFISHFRQCNCDKSVMPGGIFFFPPAASTERLAHNSTPDAARDAVFCSWAHRAVCVHACQQRDLNLSTAGVKVLSKSWKTAASDS